MTDIRNIASVLAIALVGAVLQPFPAEQDLHSAEPDSQVIGEAQLVDDAIVRLPDPYLQAFRRRPLREKSFDLFCAVGRPEAHYAEFDHLPPTLHKSTWSQWIERVGLAELPEEIGGRRVRLILRCPHPCPPGRIHARPWSTLPMYLKDSMTDWREWQLANPAVELCWYIGTPTVDVSIEDLEHEILPIVAATGCRLFALDAVRLETNVLERWAELCERYDLDMMVEPFPVDVNDDTERWMLLQVPTLTLNLRWDTVVRRCLAGTIPPFRPDIEECTPVFVKGYDNLSAQLEASTVAGDVGEALDFGARHVAVNWYRYRDNGLLRMFVEAEVRSYNADDGGSVNGPSDPGGP